ncbi:lactoylglutathione lyase [Paracoccus isoporae]|uniref:Lactoylglutathione lyase n=1 Tax=Paracoccus isoporae TaxID=591205 RepID=A0A1G6SWP1_9RHOB|nr:VOC family protein [Paracoccus isoporae]SDD21183.1 lactoylglutathione lyase [Paracoccus isoporae]
MRYHQGRLIDHIHLRVSDFGRSKEFYDAVLDVLGRKDCVSHGRDWMECDELMIDEIGPGEQASRIHLCFQAASREMVRQFHLVAIRAGGRDNGAPDLRDYHPGYYAAYVLDPDGNNIEAKFDERARARSTDSVRIETD